MFGPGDPCGPINVWEVLGFHPMRQVWRVVGVSDDCMIKPGGWCEVFPCICPSFIVVGDSGGVHCMGPVQQVIEFVALRVCEGVNHNVWVWDVVCKLLMHPFKGAMTGMILGSNDSVVPLLEVGILLVEDIQYVE